MSDSGKAVFLSYASQDAEPAKRICEALRAAGVEVWFDQSELRGGDAWDADIRRQIQSCTLFVPIISANTQSRPEGYFRLEWKLAVDRSHLMSDDHPFFVPVVIDDTPDAGARVPARFRERQWTRLPGGDASAAFAVRVKKLLGGTEAAGEAMRPAATASSRPLAFPAKKPRWHVPLIFGALVLGGLAFWQPWKRGGAPLAEAGPAAPLSEARKLLAQARSLIDDDLLTGRENFRLAEELGQRATALDPTDGEAWAMLARAQVEILARNYDSTQSRREQARVAVERASRLAPKAVESGLALGAYQAFSGQLADAERTARDTQVRFPRDPRCLMQLAAICHAVDKAPEAIELLHRAAVLPGGAVEALTAEASILRDQLHPVEAEAAVDRSLAIAPSYRGYQMKLLLTAIDLGDLARALPVVEQLPAQLQQEDLFASLIAKFWLWRGQPDRALEVLQRVPRDFFEEQRQYLPKGWLTGWAQHSAGRLMAAKAEWEQALAVVEKRLLIDANRRGLVVYRARLLALVGRRAEAEAALQLAIELEGGASGSATGIEPAVRVCLGDYEAAIRGLMVSFGDSSQLRYRGAGNAIKYEPMWAPIRGDPRIKKIIAENDEQLRVLKAGGEARLATTGDASPVLDDKSVAVLAFANLSDDKGNEYFSDGISEELLNVLAKVPGLKVSARTSAFYFKGKEVPIPEIARQLGVAYVVEGSVRKQGDKVRITAQLIKAADGFHVWSDTFTRDLKDIFAVQDEIAGLIAQSLSLKLGTSFLRKVAAVNPQAFELYVQARQAWSLRTPEGFARAEQMLDRALELAPDFVRARAALIDVVQMRSFRESKLGSFGQRHSPEIDQRLAQVRAVLVSEPDLAEAYSTLGQTLDSKWQRDEAGRAYRRATELNPNYATGRHWYGMHLAELGYMDEALAELKAACDLDPFSFIILDNYGWLLNLAGRNREAVQMLDRAAALNPGFDQTARAKATALAALGRTAEAQAIARQLKNSQRELDVWTLGLVGLHDEARTLLQRMEPGDVTNRFSALLSAGQREAALEALADPSGVSKGGVIDFLYQRIVDPVRTDPRFVHFLATLGLTEAHARTQAWRRSHPPDKPEAGK